METWKNGEEDAKDGKIPPERKAARMVEQGPRGDLHVWYAEQHVYEHWDWKKVKKYEKGKDEQGLVAYYGDPYRDNELVSEEELVLMTQCEFPNREMLAMKVYCDGLHSLLILVYKDMEKDSTFFEIRSKQSIQRHGFPVYMRGNLLIKVGKPYVAFGSSEGYVLVYKVDVLRDAPLRRANVGGPHSRVFHNFILFNAGHEISSHLQEGQVVFKTALFDHEPLFDIVGSWLVYCPTKKEVQYHKQMHSENSNLTTKSSSLYTPTKLPSSGPLLSRVLSSVSNTAADKLFKLSDLGTKKVHSYLKKKDNFIDKDVSLHSLSSSIGDAFFSTVDTLKKQARAYGENEVIHVIDIANGQTMALFKPPGGVLHLSLSPYDLHLVHASLKGDNLYMWDLCKLPKEVSLVGKFMRGKTSASIQDLVWFVNDNNTENLRGTNFGFGCITKRSGSVHWYNVNYLSGGNEANYPNTFDETSPNIPGKNQFSDSWILPSAKAVKFLKLPGCANVPGDLTQAQHNGSMWRHRKTGLVQLAFMDAENNLRLVSPLNGSHTFKYVLPKSLVSLVAGLESKLVDPWAPLIDPTPIAKMNDETPLSMAEIETAAPYLSFIHDKGIEFATYDFGDEGDAKLFDLFQDFGMEVPVRPLDVPSHVELRSALGLWENDNSASFLASSSTSTNEESVL